MRLLFGVVAGLVVGAIITLAMEAWLMALSPPPRTWVVVRASGLVEWLAGFNARQTALWLSGWLLAGLAGAMLAVAVSGRYWAGLVCGGLLSLAALFMAVLTGYPALPAAAVCVAPVTAAFVGVRLLRLNDVSPG